MNNPLSIIGGWASSAHAVADALAGVRPLITNDNHALGEVAEPKLPKDEIKASRRRVERSERRWPCSISEGSSGARNNAAESSPASAARGAAVCGAPLAASLSASRNSDQSRIRDFS